MKNGTPTIATSLSNIVFWLEDIAYNQRTQTLLAEEKRLHRDLRREFNINTHRRWMDLQAEIERRIGIPKTQKASLRDVINGIPK